MTDLVQHTADMIVLAAGQLLLIQRRKYPYQGIWALPGGKMNDHEHIGLTAARELREETGLQITQTELIPVGIFGAPGRDPRPGVWVSHAFLVCLDEQPSLRAGDDAQDARWFPISAIPPLAFDHEQMLRQAFPLVGLRYVPVLTGQRIHAAFCLIEIETSARSWEACSEAKQDMYARMAHALNAQLLLCEHCGKQQAFPSQLMEVADMLLCQECIVPPPACDLVEEDKRVRLAFAADRRRRDEELRRQRQECPPRGPEGAA